MKRTSILGLCLTVALALLAISALGASSASAGEYYWCKSHKKGEYTNATCTTKSAKAHKGKFEKVPVTTCEAHKKGMYSDAKCEKLDLKKGKPKGKFEKTTGRTYTSVGGPAELSTPAFGPGEVKCKANTDSGEITGPKTDTDRVTFTGCEFEGLPCESAGPNSTPSGESGVIETNLLDSRLVDNPETITFVNAENNEVETKGPAVGEVWEELVSSEHEPYSSEFNCGGVVFLRTQGQDTGVFELSSLNHLSTSAEVAFEKGVGADGLLTEALTEAGWQPPGGAPSIEEAGVATITNATAIEIRS